LEVAAMSRCRNCYLLLAFWGAISPAVSGFSGEIPAPKLPTRKVIELDEPFATFAVGGGGRYFAFHLQQAKRIVLLDVSEAKIVKTIDAPGDELMMTAGLYKLIIAHPSKNLIHRYDIATLKREKSAAITGPAPLQLLLGCASPGPLLTWGQKGPVSLLDLTTFKPAFDGELLGGDPQYGFGVTISSDGQTACGWTTGISGQQFRVMRLNKGAVTPEGIPDVFSDAGRWACPNYNGSLFFQNGGGIYRANLEPARADQFRGNVLIPAEDPRFFLALCHHQEEKNSPVVSSADAWICTTAGLEKLTKVENIGHVLVGGIGSEHGHIRFQPRVRYIPSANVMVVIPEGQKNVFLIEVNLPKMMRERGGEYLHVVSVPPRAAIIGKPFEYRLETISDSGSVRYAVEAGPNKLKISADGRIRWTPEERPSGGVEKIVIAAKGRGGLETFHSFDVVVERPARPTRSAIASPALRSPTTRSRAKPKAHKLPDDATASADQPTKVDADRLEIPKASFIAPGGKGRTTLVLQGKQLTVLDADGVTPKESVEFAKAYSRLGERDNYWVGVSSRPFALELIDKQSLAVTTSLKFSAQEIEDLTLHPRLPVSYVSFKASASAPRYKFITFQENRGEARESDQMIGSSLAVDPSGIFLMASYHDIYQRGASLLFNPDQIHVVPEYGNNDFLIRYALDKSGMPKVAEVKTKAGGNGRGIRLSGDGLRVTYLSVVGSPEFSGNLVGWDPTDLEKVPVLYAIKDKARTDELAFHPFLPWVACLGNKTAIFFDRESGDELVDKLQHYDFDEAKLNAMWFSSDGTALIFKISINDVHYLQRVELVLTEAERKAVDAARNRL
jgi:hypothetical protein